MAGIDPVERLLAIEEIKQLKARYFRFDGYGIYHETYVKLAGGWRIASMEIERIRTNVLLVGASSTVGMSSTPREA
jgi:hypothetical protein